MAELALGKSESRWNTNDYHWEERNVTERGRARLNELLYGLDLLRTDTSFMRISSVEMRGDITSNIRKGKTISHFEIAVVCHVEGQRGPASVTGTISCGYISVELAPADWRFAIELQHTTDEDAALNPLDMDRTIRSIGGRTLPAIPHPPR